MKWAEIMGPDGPVRYISDVQGDPVAGARLNAIIKQRSKYESFDETDIPSDITLVTYEKGGIDPYTYLDLPNK